MTYDLHCHTNCSDGQLPVEQLIQLAVEKKVSVLSITDHDTILAYQQKEYQTALEQYKEKIKIIPGIEFSTTWQRPTLNKSGGSLTGIHVLGLNINPQSEAIKQGVLKQKQARRQRAEIIAEKLEKVGLKDALQGAAKHAGIGEISRPHFAAYMVEEGFSKNTEQAFKKYLGSGKTGDIKNNWASLTEVISWIRESGGIAVLAHPHKYKLTRTKLIEMIDEFKSLGGGGMEILSGAEDRNTTKMLTELSIQKDLLASMGSDFHYVNTPWLQLGMHPRLPSACTPVWDHF